MTVDIGVEAIDRPSTMYSGSTHINAGAPASIGGQVRSIDLRASANMLDCRVAIFYLVSGTIYKVRSKVNLGNVTSGFHTYNELTLAVEVGDLIGVYFYSGSIERSAYGEAGIYSAGGDRCGVGVETDFTLFSDGDAVSLGGYITPSLAITNQLMTDILTTSAKAHGTVTSLGETPCPQHGHCWNTTGTPTIVDDKTELGAVASVPHAFESTLTDLLSSTVYYVRAYAIDGEGTVYGDDERTFRTSTSPPGVWIDEVALPFTPTGQIFFSPIISSEVYVIDQGIHFYKYNLTTRVWTELTSPDYGGSSSNRTLAISPDGTKLACCSEGTYYTGGSVALRRTGGGQRIEFYDIAGNTWTASKQIDFIITGGYPSYAKAIVWEDNDTLWVWCTCAYSTIAMVNVYIWSGVCAKYVSSTDTWTKYTNTFRITGRYSYSFPYTLYGYASPAAIKADGSVVYLGATGNAISDVPDDYAYQKYTVATDTYLTTAIALSPHTDKFCYTYDRDKLWYYEVGDTCQQGYVDVEDETQHDDQFPENTERTEGYGKYCGIHDNLTSIIAHARSIPPELMLAWPPQVTTDPALWIGPLSATLDGTLDSGGGIEPCDCGFEWGLDTGYGETTPTEKKETGEGFSQAITGLLPNTTYHFRAFATGLGTGYGADRTFVTAPATILPTVTTDPATGRGVIAVTVNGTLNQDGGEACECGFEWGLDTGYGTTTPPQSKTTGETFSQVIGGLVPNTHYHFRAFATNSVGTSYGADRNFTTALAISKAFALAREEL